MPRLPPFLVVLALGASLGVGAATETWKLPSIQGNMEGDFSAGLLPGAPAFHWTLQSKQANPRERTLALAIDGAGIRSRATAVLDPQGDGPWRLTEAEGDLAAWWPGLAAKYFPKQTGLTVTGSVRLVGEGVIRGSEISGQLELEIKDAAAADAQRVWSVAGVTLRGRLGRVPVLATDEPVLIQFRAATVGGVELRDGRVEFMLGEDGTLHVTRAVYSVLKGQVTLAPFAFDPKKNEIRTAVDVFDVELEGLRAFLPPALAEARGRVSGQVDVVWDFRRGLTVASGGLRSGAAVAASIKLAPAPGFLTGRLPVNMRERIQLLPAWLGPIGRLFSPANPAYPVLRAIELGESSLDVTEFEIGVNLDGDARGRSAHIVAMTRPTTKGTAVGSVRFEFNVTGPLADFARLLAEGRLNLQLR
jgi:hypothetical protein